MVINLKFNQQLERGKKLLIPNSASISHTAKPVLQTSPNDDQRQKRKYATLRELKCT